MSKTLEERFAELQEKDSELFKLIVNYGKHLRDKEIVDEFAEKHGLQPIPPDEQF